MLRTKVHPAEDQPWLQPEFLAWQERGPAPSAEEQLKEVLDKLKQLNPGFDRESAIPNVVIPAFENGVVIGLEMRGSNLIDISAIRALPALKRLDLNHTVVSNLSPLAGMPLTELACQCPVSDLSPLKGMPLVQLDCSNSRVHDLSPLRGMRLTRLHCYSTQVKDLSPLAGMPLAKLDCNHARVSDLSPLAGLPLTGLVCGSNELVDLSPLTGMQLTWLEFKGSQVSDLSPLQGMPLSDLVFAGSAVSDVSPLRGMVLKRIRFSPGNITTGIDAIRQMPTLTGIGVDNKPDEFAPAEFWPKYDAGEFGRPPITTYLDPAFEKWEQEVAKLPAQEQINAVVKKLQELNPGFDGKVSGRGTNLSPKIEQGVVTEFGFLIDNVQDISPVRALKGLKALYCALDEPYRGKLSDLSPLRGMRLGFLNCSHSQVSDLSPLAGMPLWDLAFNDSFVTDLSVVRGMPLELLFCDDTEITDFSPVEGMRLTNLNFTPRKISQGIDVVRQMSTLTSIGLGWGTKPFSPEEFWKKYDAGEFGKPAAPEPGVAQPPPAGIHPSPRPPSTPSKPGPIKRPGPNTWACRSIHQFDRREVRARPAGRVSDGNQQRGFARTAGTGPPRRRRQGADVLSHGGSPASGADQTRPTTWACMK